VSPELPGRAFRDGREVLAIPIGPGRHELVLPRLLSLRGSPGYRVGAGGPEERCIEGFFKQDGQLYLYGPWEPGVLVEEALARGLPEALPLLARLARALLALGGRLPESLATDAVRFLEDGAVELLSPAVMKQVRALRPPEQRRRTYEQLNHPDLKDPAARLSYSLAALLYRLVAGEYPFAADSEEEVHRRTRELRLAPLRLTHPELKPEAAQAVQRGLGRGPGPAPELAEWARLLEGWCADGILREAPAAERRELEAQAARAREASARSYRRAVFWQRHWKTVLIVTAAAAAAGIFSGTVLKNLLAPRSTRGYSPAQVVETFYRSVNELDHERMEDCVIGRAGQGLRDQVVNVYVIGRVRLGYEGRERVISAAEWDRAGRPPVVPPDTLFGITDLEIRLEGGEPNPVFRADYLLWAPSPDTGIASQPVSERLVLRRHRGDWVIERIPPVDPGPE